MFCFLKARKMQNMLFSVIQQPAEQADNQLDLSVLQLYCFVMTIHEEVLRAARRLCRERGEWSFAPEEIVRALPELNANSVRTHVISRCCINAPKNHPHKWDYFRRVRRGVYEILPAVRRDTRRKAPARVAESAAAYHSTPLRDSVHAVISRGLRAFVVECLEVAVVTQGRTLDEAVANLRQALALHLEGEDPGAFGLTASPRLVITYESALDHGTAAPTALR
jgi:hypothetical protein